MKTSIRLTEDSRKHMLVDYWLNHQRPFMTQEIYVKMIVSFRRWAWE